MNRLPDYDRTTGRSELAAFVALGFAGATLTTLALFSGPRFAGEADDALPSERMEATSRTQHNETELALTNVLFIQSPASAGQSPPPRSLAAPQS